MFLINLFLLSSTLEIGKSLGVGMKPSPFSRTDKSVSDSVILERLCIRPFLIILSLDVFLDDPSLNGF